MRIRQRPLPGLRRAACALIVCMLASAGAAPQARAQADAPGAPQSGPAAATPIDARKLAAVFLARGRPDLACDLLAVVYGSATEQPEVLMMLATCSRGLGRYEEAIGHYRRLVALQPDATQPRVELGALYLALGREEAAQQQFIAAARIAPDAESALVMALLAQELGPVGDPAAAAAAQPKRWQVELFTGLTRDSNVNAGPSSGTAAAVIGGIPVTLTLSDESRPRKAWGSVNNAGIRYLHPLSERFALLAQGSLAKTYYFGEPAFDNDSAAGGVALLYRDGGFTASLQPNIRWQRQDNNLDEVAYGSTLRLTQNLDDGLRVTGSGGYNRRDARANDNRDNHGWLASIGLGRAFGRRFDLGAEYLVQRENARLDIYSRLTHGPVLFASAVLDEHLVLTASYRYVHIRHDEREAIFPTARQDDQHNLGLTLEWDVGRWTTPGLGLRSQYYYTRNVSTVDVYDYDRHIGTFGVVLRL